MPTVSRVAAGIYAFLLLIAAAQAQTNAYAPPATYYSTATGSGATLKGQLRTITSSMTGVDYGDARYSPAYTDPAPGSSGSIILIYNRAVVSSEWDEGGTLPWNREHIWPVSRLGVSNPSNDTTNISTDQFNLRPADTDINANRANTPFGLESATGAYGYQGANYYYPGDQDAGDVARAQFYMATRYSSLSLTDSTPSGTQMGDLSSLISYHFRDVPDEFERRRNHAIYGLAGVNSPALTNPYAQRNRNPYVDHPEYVWSVFVNQANDSKLYLGGETEIGSGTTQNLNLGRVIVGGVVPAAQAVSLGKDGLNGTYYEVTTGGLATSSVNGRYNAFSTGVLGSKSINVGLATTTATPGPRSGTLTIDNLDVTTGGGAGRGANDGNDVVNVSLSVLNHANPSFAAGADVNSLTYDFGTVVQGVPVPSFSFDIFNLPTTAGFTAGLELDSIAQSGDVEHFSKGVAPFTGSGALAESGSRAFTASLHTYGVGSFEVTYLLAFSDENLSGATSLGTMALTLTGFVAPAAISDADFDGSGVVDGHDFLRWQENLQVVVASHSLGDANGDSSIDAQDLSIWSEQFGNPAASPAQAIPEPSTLGLLFVAMLTVRRRNNRPCVVRHL